jgi:hypothetical protein
LFGPPGCLDLWFSVVHAVPERESELGARRH